jgi:predicted DNA-binding protein (MmcQ/YjbR family)
MKSDSSKAVIELLANLRRVCATLPAADEYVMVHHPAFRIGKKPFAIAGMEEASKGATLSVNLGRDAQPHLLDDARFTRTPYIGQHGWVTIAHRSLKKGELETLVIDSFRRVANKAQLAALAAGSRKRV